MSFQFTRPYDAQSVLRFLGNDFLPDDFAEHVEPLDIEFKPLYIQNAKLLGDCPSLELKVFEIQHQSENDPRVGVSKDLFRLMSLYRTKRAIAILTSSKSENYRLSLATIDFVWEGNKITKEYSNPRRYSFYLGPDCKEHTPHEFLIKKGRIKDFDDLLQRFSIEVVNKEFYNAIAMLFTELVGGERKVGSKIIEKRGTLKLPGTNDHLKKQEFAVRLIGRLVFCWFLKKKRSASGKPLISDEIISKDSITDLYYHEVLESLFFRVLNTPMDQRRAEFKKVPWKDVPFLNGGLFEPHEDDYWDSDDSFLGKSKHLNTLVIKDKWFEELFDLFETYNFTIDENTSIDIELSVEPEMLGRIFENLLAEINPETGESARKSTGSFYTPRPIVEYMVDESLKQYLHTHTGVSLERLAVLLSYSHDTHDLSEKEQKDIMKALQQVKILDPACGSGAFPMGALQKILLMLQKIDPKAQESLKKVLKAAPDATIREMLRRKLEGEKDLWDYTRKLSVIQQSIYGVDIQPIAVEISKLRFFLSLVVDEKIDDNKENRGIEPLPNLEFKFVCANTLIGLPKPSEQVTMFEEMESIGKLSALRDQYFTSSGKTKQKIEQEVKELQTKMFKDILHWQRKGENFDDSQAMKLVDWDPFSDKASSWFDPDWMFGVKDGFDIVIGNPPYGFRNIMSADEKKYFRKTVGIDFPSGDIAELFVTISLSRLVRNKCILTYIIPKKSLYGESWYNVRNIWLSNELKFLMDASQAFDNVLLEQCAFSLLKQKSIDNEVTVGALDAGLNMIRVFGKFNISKIFSPDKRNAQIYKGLYPKAFLDKIDNKSLPEVSQFIKAEIGISNITKYLTFDASGNHPCVKGIDIIKYGLKEDIRYLKGKIANNYISLYEKEKIIAQEIIAHVQNPTPHIIITMFYDEKKRLLNDTCVEIKTLNKEIDKKFILGYFQSKFCNWYAYNFIYNRAIRTMHFINYYVTQIPIPKSVIENHESQKNIINIVDKILAAKKKNPQADTSELEHQIDVMVYKLYELTYDEVKIIDPAFGLSPEEYERVRVD